MYAILQVTNFGIYWFSRHDVSDHRMRYAFVSIKTTSSRYIDTISVHKFVLTISDVGGLWWSYYSTHWLLFLP